MLRHWSAIVGDPEGYLRRTLYNLAADGWRRQRAWGSQGGNGPAPGCIQGHETTLGGGAGNGWPAFIRSRLACGAYTVAGR